VAAAEVSVVIPALEEEACMRAALDSVRGLAEVIVVDGGSRDRTLSLAREAGALVLSAPACRGLQLDMGARAAGGDWLVFLHADTRLEAGWKDALIGLDRDVFGGAFRFAVDSPRPAFRWIETVVSLRCRALGLAYGDQSIFARRDAYERAGGFPHIPLMEDVAFVGRLRRAGKLAWPRVRAFTSPRRWERLGVVRATAHNWTTLLLYAAGWPAARLARRY
jgi:rSAM/selenodomain-associated transferase 2